MNYTCFIKFYHWEQSILFILVPPLEGFVMNRVQGDYFETLLYKIFVSIDEHTNVAEVSVPMSCERILPQDWACIMQVKLFNDMMTIF